MREIWRLYLVDLREPALIGPGTRENLPPGIRRVLHILFTTLHFAGFYLLFKPIGWAIVAAVCDQRVRGHHNFPITGGYVVVSNHLGMIDPIATTLWLPRSGYCMVKAEYFKTPILGGIVVAMGGFPVRRGEADRQAIRTALSVLKRGMLFGMYPEGTRSKTFKLQKAHEGAALIVTTSGAPIIPAAIWGTENIMRRHKWGFLRRPRVNLVFGQPYDLKAEGAAFAAAHSLPPNKRGRHDDLEFLSDIMMLKIADMMPLDYRGDFTADAVAARYRDRIAAKAVQKKVHSSTVLAANETETV